MRITLSIGVWACAMAASLSASTIDVSSQTSQQLQTGDTLAFLFSGSSYATHATGLGISPYPEAIHFTFASMPVSVAGQFTAEVESADGTVAAAFPGPIDWTSGVAQNSGYSGSISALVDTLTLSSALSQAIFSGPTAELILTYTGADVAVGMQGNNMRRDMAVSLSGGPLSVGGIIYSVALNDDGAGAASTNSSLPAPEPDSLALILAGAGLCIAAWGLKRFQLRRAEG
jgi:hypothetical protein